MTKGPVSLPLEETADDMIILTDLDAELDLVHPKVSTQLLAFVSLTCI